MTSSSDSESSRWSESDSESSAEEPPQPAEACAVKSRPLSVSDWQLGNWIRSSQQNSSTESQDGTFVSESPAHKQLLATQSSKQTRGDTSKELKISTPRPSPHQKGFTDNPSIPQQHSQTLQNNHLHQRSCQKSLSNDKSSCRESRKFFKQAEPRYSDCSKAALGVKGEDVATTRETSFTDSLEVKKKTGQRKKDTNTKSDKTRTKHTNVKKQKARSDVTLVSYGNCPSCGASYPNPCSCPAQSPAQPDQLSPAPQVRISSNKTRTETMCQSRTKGPHRSNHKNSERSGHAAKSSWDHFQPPGSLLVKINLSLLTRVPQKPSIPKRLPSTERKPTPIIEQEEGSGDAFKMLKKAKIIKKLKNVEEETKILPKKKQKLENENPPSAHASVKVEKSSRPVKVRDPKTTKKHFQDRVTPKDVSKNCSGKTQESSKEAVRGKDFHKHKKKNEKHAQQTRAKKQKQKSSSLHGPPACRLHREALSNRPLLTFDERQHPVKHYIKEAKRLKHKADAESDKLSKAFNYLDAAMFFVESGIAMEKDPQISLSSYTMFAETVELLKFVLKLKNPVDSSASSSETDFVALCLKCQSLLQMAMFRHKHKTAVTFSKTLIDHFNNSAQASHNLLASSKVAGSPSTNTPSPAIASTKTGVSDASGNSVSIPEEIEQVAFSYVGITTLFLSAHEIWEQVEALARQGSGLLAELDAVMGPLSLTSTMASVVRYTRQGVHWLRLESQKV